MRTPVGGARTPSLSLDARACQVRHAKRALTMPNRSDQLVAACHDLERGGRMPHVPGDRACHA